MRKSKYVGEKLQKLLFAAMLLMAFLSVPRYAVSAAETGENSPNYLESEDFEEKGIKSVYIESVTRTEVRKIAAILENKCEFVLKVKTNGQKPEKVLADLNKKLRKINKAGVVLCFDAEANIYKGNSKNIAMLPAEDKGYYSVYISEDNAKTYCGAVEFINRLFAEAKKNKSSVKTGDKSFANAQKTLAGASCMAALSDAMKLYAVAASGYFTCTRVSNGFNMTYNSAARGSFDAHGSRSSVMNTLIAGKASGVCEEYAKYEKFVFSLMGIESFINKSLVLMHGWSVAKVENSAGRVMWVPFDYDIGPSYSLSRTAFDPSNTAEMQRRYKIYLEGIEGAPSVKNFENSDFK